MVLSPYFVVSMEIVFMPPFSLPHSSFSHHFPGDLIPYDGVPLEEEVSVALPLTVTFAILAAAGIVFAVACLVFNCIFRKKK